MVLHQIPTSSLLSLSQSAMVLHQIQDQNHTSKTVETKSKTIRPNRLIFNSYVGLYCSLQCGQLELSCTCRNDVGISIFLFDHTMPNLTIIMLRGAPVENMAITSAPRAHYSSSTFKWRNNLMNFTFLLEIFSHTRYGVRAMASLLLFMVQLEKFYTMHPLQCYITGKLLNPMISKFTDNRC
jgi:hypothetical protein